jgi:choice-of-anchor C domain-containing protein
MRAKVFSAAIAFALCAAITPASAAVNLITNGSFEDGLNPGEAFNTLNSGDTSITGWTVGTGSIDYIHGYWEQGPAAGDRSIDLNGTSLGSISQPFAVTPGTTYTVTFLMSGNSDGDPTVKTMVVSTTSSPGHVFSFDTTGKDIPTPMGWTSNSFSFVALGSSETITFTSTSSADFSAFGPALDLVSVSAVPEASTWAMMLIGFAGLGLVAYRRARRTTPAIAAI